MTNLKAINLEDATQGQKDQLKDMLVELDQQEKLRQQGVKQWLFVPSKEIYEKMAQYANGASCPKCKKGRVVIEVFKGNFGDTLWLKCYWGESGCDFAEPHFEDD